MLRCRHAAAVLLSIITRRMRLFVFAMMPSRRATLLFVAATCADAPISTEQVYTPPRLLMPPAVTPSRPDYFQTYNKKNREYNTATLAIFHAFDGYADVLPSATLIVKMFSLIQRIQHILCLLCRADVFFFAASLRVYAMLRLMLTPLRR